MKSAFLTAIRQVEIREEVRPSLRTKNGVLVRIKATGICGSDLHYYTQGGIGSQKVRYPFRFGHECAGIVAEVGSSVGHLKPGDPVAIDPAVSCGHCSQCKMNRPHTCENLKFLGCPGELAGALTEYLIMPESSCCKIPAAMSFPEAVITEPLSIGIYAATFIKNPAQSKIAVLGCGPIGLSVILALQHSGARQIFATDKIAVRKKAAAGLGIAYTGNPLKQDIVKDVRDMEPGGLDAVVECCGDQEAIDQAVQMLTPGGHLIIVGIPESDRIFLDPHVIRRKELSLHNVRRQNTCLKKTIDLAASNALDPNFMITHHFDLDQIKDALDLVENYSDGVIKAIIHI